MTENIQIVGGWIKVWSADKWTDLPRWQVVQDGELHSTFTTFAAAQLEARRIMKERQS